MALIRCKSGEDGVLVGVIIGPTSSIDTCVSQAGTACPSINVLRALGQVNYQAT